MKKILSFIFLTFIIANSFAQKTSLQNNNPIKVISNAQDEHFGYYLVLPPKSKNIEGVLVLLAGFGQQAAATFPETNLDSVAYENNILTVAIAGGNKLYADEAVQTQLTKIFKDILKQYNVSTDRFVLGGFSAGGAIALRYTQLCNEYPDKFPIKPKAVFLVDSPIDIFTIWGDLEASAKNHYSEPAYEEAVRAMKVIKEDHGIPRENAAYYATINAFSMDKQYGENEKHLKETAVRTYHDVDIPWRLLNRNQTVREGNYYVTSELINRLLLMGNKKAEFMQSYQTGYRSNGQRHPHSWSIVEPVECIKWIKTLWNIQ